MNVLVQVLGERVGGIEEVAEERVCSAAHARLVGRERPARAHRVVDPFTLSPETLAVRHRRDRVAEPDSAPA